MKNLHYMRDQLGSGLLRLRRVRKMWSSRAMLIRQYLPKACLHGSGGPQIGEVICGGSPHLSCKISNYMDRRVTSPNWGPPPLCKQAVRQKKREGSSEVKKKICGANLEQQCQRRIVFRRTRKECSPSDWLKLISLAARQIRSTTQISEVTRHQPGISAAPSGVAKCDCFLGLGGTQHQYFGCQKMRFDKQRMLSTFLELTEEGANQQII